VGVLQLENKKVAACVNMNSCDKVALAASSRYLDIEGMLEFIEKCAATLETISPKLSKTQ